MRPSRLFVFLAAYLFWVASAFPQAATLTAGPTTNGHVPVFVQGGYGQPIVRDGGGSGGSSPGVSFNPSELGVTAISPTNSYPSASSGSGPNREHLCAYDAPITNATGFHYICLDANANGGELFSVGAGGGAASLPLQFLVNGVTYQFPFTASGIVGPNPSTVGDGACFNNTTGTLAKDCGPYAPVVATNAALRALAAGFAPSVWRSAFSASAPAPPMLFIWQASCPGTPDNLGLYVAPNAGGSGCWSAAASAVRFDTREWGSINDSTPTTCGTDNAAAFNSAFTALGAGAILYNDGGSCLKSTVTMSQSGQSVACRGGGFSGAHHDVGAAVLTAPAPLIAGTVGMTMFTQIGATIQAISGLGMDCVLAGNSVAAIGIDASSIRGGNYNVTVSHFSTTGIKAEINGSQTDAAGSSYNTYNIYVDQGGSTDGAAYQCFGNSSWDCSQDKFTTVAGVWNGRVPAVDFDGSDTEYIGMLSLYDSQTGSACGLRFRAGSAWMTTARNNRAHYVGVSSAGVNACAVYAEGTEAGGGRTVASNWNTVDIVDFSSGGTSGVSIGTPGGTLPGPVASTVYNMLWYSTNQVPPYWLNSAGATWFNTMTLGTPTGNTEATLEVPALKNFAMGEKIGATAPLYLGANQPFIGMNIYWNGTNFAYGDGSSASFGSYWTLNSSTGTMTYFTTPASGNAGATAAVSGVVNIDKSGDINTFGVFQNNGVSGISKTCTVMPTGMTISGGIITSVTGGTCS